jgi:anti-sigma factor ChrR (cupin superfamily)
MNAVTPNNPKHAGLPPLLSRYSVVDELPWKPTPVKGVDMKVLVEDKQTGMMTALFRWAPGTSLPMHEHVEIEQSWVLEGEFEDDEGVYTQGNFVWRPAGHRHIARSPKGALVLCFFLKPNRFVGGEFDGKLLD